MKIKALISIVLVLLLTGCSLGQSSGMFQKNPEQYETSFYDLFDTVTTIKGYAKTQEEFTSTATRLYAELEKYHQLFDIYNTYDGVNNLKTINDNAGRAPVEVDEKLIDLVLFGKEIYQESGGRVNIFMGSVLGLWHEAREAAEKNPAGACVPEDALLQEAAAHTDPDRVIIDAEAKTVYLEDPAQRIDAGAIGKGYAAEQVMKTIQDGQNQIAASADGRQQTATKGQSDDGRQQIATKGQSADGRQQFATKGYAEGDSQQPAAGAPSEGGSEEKAETGKESDPAFKSYVLNLGGNICVSAPKPDGSTWAIGVQDPDSDGYLRKLGIRKGSVVTSGDYQRYFTAEGKRYHHIIDPDTLQPAEKWRSVTIIADSSAVADFLSTALFLMSREEGTALLQKYNAQACWIDKDGRITESDGFVRLCE